MWPQQAQGMYYSGWGGAQLPSNPTPQSTDPSDWAQKAAQWAQQKQVQEQQYQQQQQQQYQYLQSQQYQQQQLYQQQTQYQQPADQQAYQYQQQYPSAVTQASVVGGASYPAYSTPSGAAPASQVPPVAAQSPVPPPLPPSSSSFPSTSAPPDSNSTLQPKPLFAPSATPPVQSLDAPKVAEPPLPEIKSEPPANTEEMSDGSVNQELTQRMKLFKEQLAMISSQTVPSEGVVDVPGASASSPMRAGERGGGAMGRGGQTQYNRGRGFTPRGLGSGPGQSFRRGGMTNQEFESRRGGGGGVGAQRGGRGGLVNPDFDRDGGGMHSRRGGMGRGRGGYDRGRGGFRGGGGGGGGSWGRGGGGKWGGYEEEEGNYRTGESVPCRGRGDQQFRAEDRRQQYDQRGRGGRGGTYGGGRGGGGNDEYYSGYGQHSEGEGSWSRGASGNDPLDWEQTQQQLGQNKDQYKVERTEDQYGMEGNRDQYGMEGNRDQYGMEGNKDQYGREDVKDQYGKEGSKDHYRFRQSADEYRAGGEGRNEFKLRQSEGANRYQGYDDRSAESAAVSGESKESEFAAGSGGRSLEVGVEYGQREEKGQQSYGTDSNAPVSYDQTEDRDSPSFTTTTQQSSVKSDAPTISSLRKGGSTTVIPGLGSSDEPEPSQDAEEEKPADTSEVKQEEKDLKSSLKTQLVDVFGGSRAEKMVQSMERIVNQLQTLKGLESSLKVLQYMGEKGKDDKESKTVETDPMEEARKKVAALLATESDSDGEDDMKRGASYHSPHAAGHAHNSAVSAAQPHYDNSSDMAREFDVGTYDIKPKVFGTYSNDSQDPSYQDRQSGHGRNSRGDMSRPEDYREGSYDRGVRGDGRQNSAQGRGNFRNRGEYGGYDNERVPEQREGFRSGQGYREDYPQHGRTGNMDERYDNYDRGGGRDNFADERRYGGDRMGESRDYRHPMERMGGPYQGEEGYAGDRDYRRGGGPDRLREEMWERQDYDASMRGLPRGAPSYDHHHRPHPPASMSPTPMDLEPEEKTNISQKMETIDYSHGVQAAISASRGWAGSGGDQPAVQSVDYHHGQGTMQDPGGGGGGGPGGEYGRDYPPMDLQAAAYGGGFPAYPGYEGFPPSTGLQSGGFFPGGMDAATLFAAYSEQTGDTKRKALPKWLREELEKMEKKRQKTLEKEAEQRSRQGVDGKERPAWRDEDSEPEDEEKPLGAPLAVPALWKNKARVSMFRQSQSPSSQGSDELEPALKRLKRSELTEDDEERKANMMLKLRKMMTEILLDVTSEEIDSVAREAYEEEKNKIRFMFKEPKIKPKRATKAPNILATLSMYESSSDSEEEVNGAATAGAKILSKPSKVAIAKAFEDTPPSSSSSSSSSVDQPKSRKHKSKWDVTDTGKSSSSSKKESSKSKSSSSHSSSSSSSSSDHSSSRKRSSSSGDRDKSSSSRSSSSSSKSSSSKSSSSSTSKSSSKSSRHRSKSPSKSSRSSSSKSSSSSSKSIPVGTVPTTTPTLSERWGGGGAEEKSRSTSGDKTSSKESLMRTVSPSHSMFRYQ